VRVLESVVVGLALAVVVAGAVLGVLVTPPVTRTLVRWLDVAASGGLSPAQAESLAEDTRLFVTDRSAPPLPAQVGGMPAFDGAAVAHLEDVRELLLAARLATGVLAGLLAVWLVVSVARRRMPAIASALFAGALCCAVLPVVGAVLAFSDFEWFFSAFHAVFFEAGTWTFPSDALLIRLFPEPFWASVGALWAGGIVLGGVMLGAAALGVRSAGGARPAVPRGEDA